MPLFSSRKEEKKVKVTFANGLLFVENDNGKQQAFPLAWLPALQNASEEDQQDWTLTASGLHFNKLNVDIAITGL